MNATEQTDGVGAWVGGTLLAAGLVWGVGSAMKGHHQNGPITGPATTNTQSSSGDSIGSNGRGSAGVSAPSGQALPGQPGVVVEGIPTTNDPNDFGPELKRRDPRMATFTGRGQPVYR